MNTISLSGARVALYHHGHPARLTKLEEVNHGQRG